MADNYLEFIQGIRTMRQILRDDCPPKFKSYWDNLEWKYLHFKDGYFPSLTLFRASKINEEEISAGIGVHRLSYPDPERNITVRRGRANIQDYPVLYSTPDFIGSVMELVLTQSDSKISSNVIPKFAYVSQWVLKKPDVLKVHDINQQFGYDKRNKLTYEEANAFNFYLKHLQRIFTSPLGYDFSSHYAHHYLVGVEQGNNYKKWLEDPVEVLKYPTVVKNGLFDNYAVTPTCFDNKFKFSKVYKIELPEINKIEQIGNGLYIKPISVGTLQEKSDTITWGRLTQEDYAFFHKPS